MVRERQQGEKEKRQRKQKWGRKRDGGALVFVKYTSRALVKEHVKPPPPSLVNLPFPGSLCDSPHAQHMCTRGGVMTWDLHSDFRQRHARERMEVNELTSPPPWTRLLPMPNSLLSYTHWQVYTQTPDKTAGLNAGIKPRIRKLKHHGAMGGFTLSTCTLNTAHNNRWVMNNCESNLTYTINMTCKHQLTRSKRHYTIHFS